MTGGSATPVSIDASIDRLVRHFRRVRVHPPTRQSVEILDDARDDVPFAIPEGLIAYYEACDGIEIQLDDEVVGNLYSADQSEEAAGVWELVERHRLWPLRGDGCGNHDVVLLEPGFGHGACAFWDHETARIDGLLASNVGAYVASWAEYLTSVFTPDGALAAASRKHPWPFDPSWLRSRDLGAPQLLDDPRLERVFGSRS